MPVALSKLHHWCTVVYNAMPFSGHQLVMYDFTPDLGARAFDSGLQDCCMVTVSHTEVELWAVTDEVSEVHKNTQVRILINGPRVGLSCTIQWKKCICTLLLPFFKLAKTKQSTWVAVLFYFLTGRSTGTIIQQQPPHLMSIICLFFPLLENTKAALWCYEMYWMPMK